ncbi:unnamed protein product [Enterobius vermicularis]|uniref:Ovule protein n=1 Tax=Enterobius vermicularis TaxID=51028 RepID=A0A0N4V2R7_ENTVE|nr:unnamed protein product [Enterobius vermicularis]
MNGICKIRYESEHLRSFWDGQFQTLVFEIVQLNGFIWETIYGNRWFLHNRNLFLYEERTGPEEEETLKICMKLFGCECCLRIHKRDFCVLQSK